MKQITINKTKKNSKKKQKNVRKKKKCEILKFKKL